MTNLSDIHEWDQFESRFNNWMAWCRMRGVYQERAGSAEGFYRSPQHWEPQNPKPDWLVSLNEPDAVMVNRAYSQLGVRARQIIKVLWFRSHWRVQWQAQKLGCHHTELRDLGHTAKTMLRNRLRFIEKETCTKQKISV